MIVTCSQCGVGFPKPQCWAKRTSKHFCSRACYAASMVNKISAVCKICSSVFTLHPSDLKKYSTCGKACSLKARRDDRNGNWRGGVTSGRKKSMSTAKYKQWRRSVFERDNFTCVDCGHRGGDLEADHIKQWAHHPRLRYAVSNGATKCKECHRERKSHHRRAYQFKLYFNLTPGPPKNEGSSL